MTHQRYFSRILLYLGHLSHSHPRRPRGSQSGRDKKPDESFQARAEEPLATDPHLAISKRLGECWLLIGHKKCFHVKYIWNNSFLNCIHFWYELNKIDLAPNVWLHSSIGRATHRQRGGHGFESRWSPDFFQASSFQLLQLENLLRWSFFTFKKCFVFLCPIGEQHLLSSFRAFVHDRYCLAILVLRDYTKSLTRKSASCKNKFLF